MGLTFHIPFGYNYFKFLTPFLAKVNTMLINQQGYAIP